MASSPGPAAASRRRRPRRPLSATVIAAGACLALVSACANPQESTSAAPSSTASKAETAVKRDAELYAMVPAAYREAGRIRVATNAPFPPFEMFAGSGGTKLAGLEIDLGEALGRRLGVPFAFSQQPFDGLLPGLQAKKYDALMAALFDTEEREKTVDFVDYGRSGSALLVKKGNPEELTTLDGLCGHQAAAQTGAQQINLLKQQSDRCIEDGEQAITVKTFPQFSDALLALKTGKAETIVGDLPVLRYSAERDDSVESVEDPTAPQGYDPAPLGIALPKDQPKLREAVRRALADLIDSGVYGEILARYDVAQIAIDAPTVNQAGE
ncbi:ABC transporter substrate-binding protein [Streptomyces sp. NPDC019396]|uniref:ABC transporter substrate-binding protein n=1 Tax=Streptomyces sp. NPDC019396 TaxID=3154687 RepID=UPI003404C301